MLPLMLFYSVLDLNEDYTISRCTIYTLYLLLSPRCTSDSISEITCVWGHSTWDYRQLGKRAIERHFIARIEPGDVTNPDLVVQWCRQADEHLFLLNLRTY